MLAADAEEGAIGEPAFGFEVRREADGREGDVVL